MREEIERFKKLAVVMPNRLLELDSNAYMNKLQK